MEQKQASETPRILNSADCIDVGIAFQDYAKFVQGLFVTKGNLEMRSDQAFTWNLTHAAMGIGGESGEVVDLIKKVFANGRALDKDKLIKEMGDLQFYIQALCNVLGISLMDVIVVNTAKLNARYPDGYSDAASLAKADEKSELYELDKNYYITDKSDGLSYSHFKLNGWTDMDLLNNGYIAIKEGVILSPCEEPTAEEQAETITFPTPSAEFGEVIHVEVFDNNPCIELTPAEIQSNHNRVQWAESLLLQMFEKHEGRNSWLMNYGVSTEAKQLRAKIYACKPMTFQQLNDAFPAIDNKELLPC